MAKRDELPIGGRNMSRFNAASLGLHAVLIIGLILLSRHSIEQIATLKAQKEQQAVEEKTQKLNEAVAKEQLKEDIEDIVEAIEPEATAEEVADKVDALLETIDEETLIEKLADAMASPEEESEEYNTEGQDTDESDYSEALKQEILESYAEANALQADDALEAKLLEELVYEDLPAVENNLDNALKQQSLESLAASTLKEKAKELSQLAKANALTRLDEDIRNKNRSKEYSQNKIDIEESYKAISQAQAEGDILAAIKASESLAEQTESALSTLRENNPFTESALSQQEQSSDDKLAKAQKALSEAQATEKKATDKFETKAKDSLASAKEDIASAEADPNQKKRHQNTLNKSEAAGQAAINDKNISRANQQISNYLNHAKAVMHKDKEAAERLNNARQELTTAAKQAMDATRKRQAAEQALRRALHSARQESYNQLRQVAQQAKSRAHRTKFATMQALTKKASGIEAQARQRLKSIRTAADIKKAEDAITAMQAQKRELAEALNNDRQSQLKETEKRLSSLKELSADLKLFASSLNDASREQITQQIKSESLDKAVEKKANTLREQLQAGTDQQKDQRKEAFASDAKQTLQDVLKAQSELQTADNQSESDGQTSESKTLPIPALGEGLSDALAQAITRPISLEAGEGESGEEKEKKKSPAKSIGSGSGLEVDELATRLNTFNLKNPNRYRKLTDVEKAAILTRNDAHIQSTKPPILRFARPTLNATRDNDELPSADIFTGKVEKREVAALNPNRARKAHPTFANKNFSAIPFAVKVPILDGDGSDWNLKSTQLKPGKSLHMQWRPDGLYGFGSITDKSGRFENGPSANHMLANFWEFDSLEFWFDMKNTKADKTYKHACQQFFMFPGVTPHQAKPVLREVIWTKGGGLPLHLLYPERTLKGKPLVATKKIGATQYNIEFFIPRALITNLEYFKAGQVLGFTYIINHSRSPHQSESFLDNYNPNFHYSSQPKSWGNLQLLGTDAALNTLTATDEPSEYPTVEVSQPLGLHVNDPDSNTDISAVNTVTVRVKNQFTFDGKKGDGDWEDVRLVETGKNTGIFKGWVNTTLLPSTTGDQKLGVQPGDKLDVSYNDYVKRAGEYDQKLNVEVQVVSPLYTVEGANRLN